MTVRSKLLGIVLTVCAVMLLAFSAQRMDLGRVAEAMMSVMPGQAGTQPAIAAQFWPLQLETRQDVSGRVMADLPLFTHVESRTVKERQLDPETLQTVTMEARRTWLVHPFGYVLDVAEKMLESIEIAAWGTLLAVSLGLPLAFVRARPLGLPTPLRTASRTICAGFRAIPEFLVALILVAAIGFGPPAGILALGVHAAGFLGRFYADAIEDADQKPVGALCASGAGRLVTFAMAIVPQVRGPFASSTLYILDRNVRMAAVIGIVGAGGIGQELKGRIDMYDYGHVSTIVLAIFIVVLALDEIAFRLRRNP